MISFTVMSFAKEDAKSKKMHLKLALIISGISLLFLTVYPFI